MHIASRFSSLVFLLLAIASSATAQQNSPLPQPTGRIHLDVVVSPRSGMPMAGLQQQDFKVIDNKAAQTVTSFEELGGEKAPIEVLLVVDAVNAPFSTVATERDQIEKYLRAHGEHLAYPTSVALLSDTGMQFQPTPSTDGNALSAVLDSYTVRLRTIRRSTGVYGADERLNISISALHQLAAREAARPGRKMILWISPGWPLLSGPGIRLGTKEQQQVFASIVQLSTELRKGHITLYALDALGANESILRSLYYETYLKGVAKPQDANLGNLALQVIATQTGGTAMNSNDLGLLLERCMSDTTAYYEITFDPPPAEHRDEYHRVEVQVARPGVTARTLQGYYSEP